MLLIWGSPFLRSDGWLTIAASFFPHRQYYAGLVSFPAFILGLCKYLVTSNILKVVLYVFLPGQSVCCAFNTGVEIEKLCSCHVHSSQNPTDDLHFSFYIMFVQLGLINKGSHASFSLIYSMQLYEYAKKCIYTFFRLIPKGLCCYK